MTTPTPTTPTPPTAAAPTLAAESHTISIYVEGGVVQDVDNVPPGVTVRVVDYDNDGDKDDGGEDCSIELHEGEPVLGASRRAAADPVRDALLAACEALLVIVGRLNADTYPARPPEGADWSTDWKEQVWARAAIAAAKGAAKGAA